LFLALSTIPYLLQASYVGLDGLLFSFYEDEDQILAVFSNASSPLNCHTQLVDQDNVKLYGQAVAADPMATRNACWFFSRPSIAEVDILGLEKHGTMFKIAYFLLQWLWMVKVPWFSNKRDY
jgi:hypothetical protein